MDAPFVCCRGCFGKGKKKATVWDAKSGKRPQAEEEAVVFLRPAASRRETSGEKKRGDVEFSACPMFLSPSLCFSLSLSFPWCSPQRLSRRARCLSCCCCCCSSSKDRKRASARARESERERRETKKELHAGGERKKKESKFTAAPRRRCATSPGASCRAGPPADRRGPQGGLATTF